MVSLNNSRRSRTITSEILSTVMDETVSITFLDTTDGIKLSFEPSDAVRHAWDAAGSNPRLLLTVCDPNVDCPVSAVVRVIVSASTPVIARGGSLPITLTLEAEEPFPAVTFAVTQNIGLLDGSGFPMVSLNNSRRSRTITSEIPSGAADKTILVTFVDATDGIKLSFEPSDAVKHAWDAAGSNPRLVLTTCDPDVDCPAGNIKLKIRVYLEGALPRR